MVASPPVYLDNAATTRLDPLVAVVMRACLEDPLAFGNASSITHVHGRAAAQRIEAARAQVAASIGAQPEWIVFTSGATESINLALQGVARANADRPRHFLSARTEHRATLDPLQRLERDGAAVGWVPLAAGGVVEPAAVEAAIREDTRLVSLMQVNNETGVITDIARIGAVCRERGTLLHCDAAQALGKLPTSRLAREADLVSINAHKIHGPQGVGALCVSPRAKPWLRALILGGGQERGLRSGTLATHQIAGFGEACALAAREGEADARRMRALRERLWNGLRALPGVHQNGPPGAVSPAILSVSFEGVEGESLVMALTELAVSTGSACSSASDEASYVLRALGRDPQLAQATLRFSLGRDSSEADVDVAVRAVTRELARLRAVAP